MTTEFGHFTTMRVANGRVRGLSLHLARLDRDAGVVFGTGVDGDQTRAAVLAAVPGPDPIAVRVTATVAHLRPGHDQVPDLTVTTRALPDPTPLRVRTVSYRRDLPEVKHVGTFSLFHQRGLAVRAGYDDALFHDSGLISEGTTWNVLFFAGDTVVLPDGPALAGVTLALLRTGLAIKGIPVLTRQVRVGELAGFDAAFAVNALAPVRPITTVDSVDYPVREDLTALLTACHELNPEERL